MSTAVVQQPIEETRALSTASTAAHISEPQFADQHPLTLLAVFIGVSLAAALAFVGALAIWLYAIRDTGVMSVRM
jgi:hypothetical protein